MSNLNIYAVRDRLIDYFQTPFVGPSDKSVMASLQAMINNGEVTNGINQAPHQYELWRIGEVTEEGDIHVHKELLCTCDSLVRPGVRDGATPGNGALSQPLARVNPPGGRADELANAYRTRRDPEESITGPGETATHTLRDGHVETRNRKTTG